MDSLLQLPRFKILDVHKPFTLALEEEADLIECALNFEVSIPDDVSTDKIHLDIVDLEISW